MLREAPLTTSPMHLLGLAHLAASSSWVPYRGGEEGLRLASEKTPDIIVLDMMLPKLGGEQLLQLLKGDPLTAKIPVVVLSSLSQKNGEKLMSAGAAAYLEKSNLALEQCPSKLSRTISKILGSIPRDCLVRRGD